MRDLLLRLDRWPRRVVAVLLLLVAAVTAVGGHRPATAQPVSGRPVVVAARDLPAGAVVAPGDVALATADRAPPSALEGTAAVVGRRVAGPIGRGEVVTPTRLLGSGLATGLTDGRLAVAVPVARTGSGLLARAGDTVELIAGPGVDGGVPEVLVAAAPVLASVPGGSDDTAGSATGAELVVATDAAGALRISTAASRDVIAAVLGPS